MKTIGTYLLIFGIGSIVLNLIGMNFSILMWVDLWGPTVGWVIRAAFVALGAALFFFGPEEVDEDEAVETA